MCVQSHWRLLAFKPQERTIEYLNSLQGSGAEFTNTALRYLKQELGSHFVREEWTLIELRSMRQKNLSDCGVFTVLNGLALLRDLEPSVVQSINGMQDARERIAYTLIKRKITTEFG
jgi:Ulp1 family protease